MKSKNLKSILGLLIYLLVMSLAFQARALTREILTDADACTKNSMDPYEMGWLMPEGEGLPYAGKCIDAQIKRPAHILKSSSESISFANFYHAGKFWIATVRYEDVAEAWFQIVKWNMAGGLIQPAHTQLRFLMKEDKVITLECQYANCYTQTVINSFIFSIDYIAPEGVPYSPVAGLRSIFQNTMRFISIYDQIIKAKTQKTNEDILIEQYALKLDPEDVQEILFRAVEESEKRGYSDVYQTKTLNCTTELFAIINSVLDPDAQPFKVGFANNPIKKPALRELRQRGLIDSSSPRNALHLEHIPYFDTPK